MAVSPAGSLILHSLRGDAAFRSAHPPDRFVAAHVGGIDGMGTADVNLRVARIVTAPDVIAGCAAAGYRADLVGRTAVLVIPRLAALPATRATGCQSPVFAAGGGGIAADPVATRLGRA